MTIEQPLIETIGQIVSADIPDIAQYPLRHTAAEQSFPGVTRMSRMRAGLQKILKADISTIELTEQTQLPSANIKLALMPPSSNEPVCFEDEPLLRPAPAPYHHWRKPPPPVLHFDSFPDGITRTINGRRGVVDPITHIGFDSEQ